MSATNPHLTLVEGPTRIQRTVAYCRTKEQECRHLLHMNYGYRCEASEGHRFLPLLTIASSADSHGGIVCPGWCPLRHPGQ